MSLDDTPDLGPCCACEKTGPSVRNIFTIPYEAAVPNHGWGCVVCALPPNGASYVLCDECCGPVRLGLPQFPHLREPRFACRGYPAKDGREPIETARTRRPWMHDMSKHAGER
jgi:hypothetical protein